MDGADNGCHSDNLSFNVTDLFGSYCSEHEEDREASQPDGREARCSTPSASADTDDRESDGGAELGLLVVGKRFRVESTSGISLPPYFTIHFDNPNRKVHFTVLSDGSNCIVTGCVDHIIYDEE